MSHEPKDKIESLVTAALKEAMEKRKLAKDIAIAHAVFEMPDVSAEPTATDVEPPPMPTVRDKELEPNQRMFSSLVRAIIPAKQDFPVTVFHDYAWHEAVASLIPAVDKTYVFDIQLASAVLQAWELGNRTLAYGPSGAGKSSLIEQLCALTSRPFIRINCTGDMDSSMIFGQLTAQDGSTVWVDGPVTEAVKYGAVFAWDEWDVTPPEISMGLQWLLEDGGKLMLKEKPGTMRDKQIVPDENFRLVAIGNTQGQGDDTGSHAGTNVQNTATLDRFGTAIYVDYLKPTEEEVMVSKKYGHLINKGDTKNLIKFANLVRTGYKAGQLNLTVSPRTLFNICKMLAFNGTIREATKLVYINKLNDTQKKVAEELFNKVFGAA
jgi:cobaltochelatase CobS